MLLSCLWYLVNRWHAKTQIHIWLFGSTKWPNCLISPTPKQHIATRTRTMSSNLVFTEKHHWLSGPDRKLLHFLQILLGLLVSGKHLTRYMKLNVLNEVSCLYALGAVLALYTHTHFFHIDFSSQGKFVWKSVLALLDTNRKSTTRDWTRHPPCWENYFLWKRGIIWICDFT